MAPSIDSDRPADTASDLAPTAAPDVRQPRFWQQLKETKVHFTVFLGLAILGPLAMYVLVWVGGHDRPMLDIVGEAIVTAWIGPGIFVVIMIMMNLVHYRKLRRVVIRQSSEAGSMLVSMLAARYRHYQTTDVPYPLKAAVLDIGTYLRVGVPPKVAAQWLMDGVRWYATETRAGELPPLPSAQVKCAETVLRQTKN